MKRRLHAERLESRILLAADLPSGMEYIRSTDARTELDDTLPTYLAGDANQDGSFDELDVLTVLQAGKYMSSEPADWSEGDWNGAPGGSVDDKIPPSGNGRFDQLDIIAALSAGTYLQGSYCAEPEFAAVTPAVPEPSTFLLLGFALATTVLIRRHGQSPAADRF